MTAGLLTSLEKSLLIVYILGECQLFVYILELDMGHVPDLSIVWFMIISNHCKVISSFCVGIVVIRLVSMHRFVSDIFRVRLNFLSMPGIIQV